VADVVLHVQVEQPVWQARAHVHQGRQCVRVFVLPRLRIHATAVCVVARAVWDSRVRVAHA
jgi:hypothetical protein